MTPSEFFKKYGREAVKESLKQSQLDTEFNRTLSGLIMSHEVIDKYKYLNLAHEALERLRDLEKGIIKPPQSFKGVLLDSEVLEYHIKQVELCQ